MLSCFSRVQLLATLWTAACQALLSIGFFRQEYWSGLPCPPPGDLPNPGIKRSLTSPALSGRFFTTSATWEASYNTHTHMYICITESFYCTAETHNTVNQLYTSIIKKNSVFVDNSSDFVGCLFVCRSLVLN